MECDEVKRNSAPSAGKKSLFNKPVFIIQSCRKIVLGSSVPQEGVTCLPPESTDGHIPAGNTFCSSCSSQGSRKHDWLPALESPNSLISPVNTPVSRSSQEPTTSPPSNKQTAIQLATFSSAV